MLTDSIEVMRYVRASAGRAGLGVVFEDTNQPRHDGKTIFLPTITKDTTPEQMRELMASVDHEVAHERFSSFKLLHDEKLNPSGILMHVWNMLEDSRVNAIEAAEYTGFRENWDETTTPILERVLTKLSTEKGPTAKVISALISWEAKLSQKYFPLVESTVSKYRVDPALESVISSFSPRLLEAQETLNKEKGSLATYTLAKDILTKLGKECSKELKPEPAPAAKGKGKGEKEGTHQKEAAAKGGAAEEESTSDKEDKPFESTEYKVIEVTLTEEQKKEFSITLPKEGSKMGHIGINLTPTKKSRYSWELCDIEKFTVVNYPKGINIEHYSGMPVSAEAFKEEYQKRVANKFVTQENFAQQVRRLIQIRAKTQTVYGQKKGKLDQSRLSRICFNAPGFNEKVFKQKIENKTLDAAITVLVDMSGSMGGDKAYFSLASTLLLNEVCTVLGIPVEILGFTDGYNHDLAIPGVWPIMFIYKGFDTLKVSTEDIIHSFALSSSFMAGNPDGENILWAYDRLVKRKEKRRIMVVMSDGSPAAGRPSHGLSDFTLKVIKDIEASKKVDIYGLGILSRAVECFYTHNDVVTTAESIPSKLISLIERKIINEYR